MVTSFLAPVSPSCLKKARQKTSMGALLRELLQATLRFRTELLASMEGVPQHNSRVLALLGLQKRSKRLPSSPCRQQLTLLRHEAPALLLHQAGAQTGFEQSGIQQSHLTLGKPIHPDCSTATDLRVGHVPRAKLRDREFSSQPNG